MKPMAKDTRRRRLVLALALGAALLLLSWGLWPAPVPLSTVVPQAKDQAARPNHFSRLTRSLRAALTRTTRVHFLVRDEQGEALGGIRLSMDQHPGGVTDVRGLLTLDGVPWGNGSGPKVEGPWEVLAGTTAHWIQGAEQRRLLILRRVCPGVVRLQDDQGRPVVGALVNTIRTFDVLRSGGMQKYQRSDSAGEVTLPYRPCGTAHLDIEHEENGHIPWLSGEVVDGEPLVLTLPSVRHGVLAVVDEDEAPVDADVQCNTGLSVERLGTGLFLVRSRRPWQPVTIHAAGYPSQSARLRLDGSEQQVTLQTGRNVELTVLCDDDCPEELKCGSEPCQDAGCDRFSCWCPVGESELFRSDKGWKLDTIPAAVEEFTLDLREDAAVTGRWTGSLPCDVHIENDLYFAEGCLPDGRFRYERLRPGSHTITVRHGLSEQGAVQVDLKAGQLLDVGEIGPSDLIVDGVIDADFPLLGAILRTSPYARVELESDGGFLLHGLPPDTERIALDLYEPFYGRFREPFLIPADGSLPTWYINQLEAVDTTPLDPDFETEWGDTGDSGAPSYGERDSGLLPWDDSGWRDSGEF